MLHPLILKILQQTCRFMSLLIYAYPLYKKTGKIQVNYIQVLVTTPNMEKPQKVFRFLF